MSTENALAFTANPLDRAGTRRGDPAWLAARRAAPGTRFLVLDRLKPLLTGPEEAEGTATLALLDRTIADRLGPPGAQEVFLGLSGDIAFFARDISEDLDAGAVLAEIGHFSDARRALSRLAPADIAILGQAKAMIDWHARHHFCSRCGAPTESAEAGYRRHCPACGAEHFPRTDPAVIMLVTDRDRCLLARNRRFAVSNYHSTLAGFVEPGETIEQAVRREVEEEVGLRVGRVSYFAAQPWPFPSSLMIGCYGDAETRDIRIDGVEIVAARWFERDTVRQLIAGENFEDVALPRREAIAFHLIRNWAEE